jgi:3-phenylpropionate/cinnamic acid dioxygenase small subunit
MSQSAHIARAAADSETYFQVQRFYARQMQLLDDGAAEEWADTFTADGVFAANAAPAPVKGRENIAAAARSTTERLQADGIVRRHWLGMLDVRREAGDLLSVRSYALIVETPKGGQAGVRMSTLCEDVLVREGDDWLVRERKVSRDDLG